LASWQLTDADRAMIEREVEPFLPDRVFDAHAHLFCHEHFGAGGVPRHTAAAPERLGLDEYFRFAEWLHPGEGTAGGLFFGVAFTGERDANNAFVAAEVAAAARNRPVFGQMIVPPEMGRCSWISWPRRLASSGPPSIARSAARARARWTRRSRRAR
jgi:hypothetical protein